MVHCIAPIKCKTSWSRSWSPDLLRILIGLRNRLIATLYITNFGTAFKSDETVSPPFGSRWRKRRRLNQNCFWIDINKQIYLLNTLWLFSFYEIIASQCSCNQMKLDQKRKFEIIFWRQNFHYANYLSITFLVLHL